MDYGKRLKELNLKLEQGDLTEAEQAEIELIYSSTLLKVRALSNEIKALLEGFENLKKLS